MFSPSDTSLSKTTSHKVVLPFYICAALSFLVACFLLFTNTKAFTGHYFQPHILAITHLMSLGWGTMIILGASHQLVPVLIEGKLFSERLAYLTFILSAIGVPLLVYSFYTFNLGGLALAGGSCIVISVLLYAINLGYSIARSNSKNIHSYFIFTAAIWLLATASLGLLLVYNFTHHFLSYDSLHFLALHAHLGIIGWFLLLVIGVASRLIPMFLISKYTNPKILWTIYFLVNISLVTYSCFFFSGIKNLITFISIALILFAIILFVRFNYSAYRQRIRKKVDHQIQVSLVAVALLIAPVFILAVLAGIVSAFRPENTSLALLYGFVVFFGWITLLILGMTFKTLPFIAWHKARQQNDANTKLNPKDFFSDSIFNAMNILYAIGFILFGAGIVSSNQILLRAGSVFVLLAAVLYNANIFKILSRNKG